MLRSLFDGRVWKSKGTGAVIPFCSDLLKLHDLPRQLVPPLCPVPLALTTCSLHRKHGSLGWPLSLAEELGGGRGLPAGPGVGVGLNGPEALASPGMSAFSPRLQIHVPWQKFLLFSPSGQVRGTMEVSTLGVEKALEG